MALNFPSSPAIGQVFVAPNGRRYQWTGVLWLAADRLTKDDVGLGSVDNTADAAKPVSGPVEADLWFWQ